MSQKFKNGRDETHLLIFVCGSNGSFKCGKTLMVGWVENKHTLRDLRRCT
jgi:hypothetical protein